MALCEKKSLTGCSLKIGTTLNQSGGEMNALFKIQWPRIHLLQDGGLRLFLRIDLGYWTQEEFTWDIVTKEDIAMNKILLSCSDEVCTPACRCTG